MAKLVNLGFRSQSTTELNNRYEDSVMARITHLRTEHTDMKCSTPQPFYDPLYRPEEVEMYRRSSTLQSWVSEWS